MHAIISISLALIGVYEYMGNLCIAVYSAYTNDRENYSMYTFIGSYVAHNLLFVCMRPDRIAGNKKMI